MGTRGTMAFKLDGTLHSMYNHWDSYPSGLGEVMLKFIAGMDRETVEQQIRALQCIDPEVKPTVEQKEALLPFADLNVSERSMDDWYCLLRNTQGDPEKTLQAGYYEPFPVGQEEWSYVLDLDADILEVWESREKIREFALAELPESFATLEEELGE